MAALSSSPTRIAPNREAKLFVALNQAGANWARLWITNAPPGSEYRGKLDKSRERRIPVFESDGGPKNPWTVTFDKGGRYSFVAQEYTRGATGSAGYERAPGVAPQEAKVGSEYSLTLDVGQRLTFPVGTGADTATLVLWVWADTIQPTTIETYGENSPDITAPTPTEKMRLAMESDAVRSAVAALVTPAPMAASTAIGNITAIVADMVAKINLHHGLASGLHPLGGGDDTKIPVQYASTMSPKDLATFVNVALQMLRRHRQNDGGNGPGSAIYHDPPSSAPKADFLSMPIIDAVAGLADAYPALAEIYRSHRNHQPHYPSINDYPGEYHGGSTGIYTSTDYDMTTLPPLLLVHLAVFEVLASFNSTVPPTQTSGATLLIEQAGGVDG